MQEGDHAKEKEEEGVGLEGGAQGWVGTGLGGHRVGWAQGWVGIGLGGHRVGGA